MNDSAMKEMPKYKCHKEVWALKISGIDHKENPDKTGNSAAASYGAILHTEKDFAAIEVSPEFMMKHKPEVGGYYVIYKDGYESFSPAEAFEDGYSLV